MPKPSVFDTLPEAVRDELNQKLIGSGFGDLVALADWLTNQGYTVSKSRLGEYSKGLKEKMEKTAARGRERVEIAKALRGLSEDDKAALMELNEMAAMDQLMDMYEAAADMALEERMEALPKLIRAQADLSRSAVGSAKWKRELETAVYQARLDVLKELRDFIGKRFPDFKAAFADIYSRLRSIWPMVKASREFLGEISALAESVRAELGSGQKTLSFRDYCHDVSPEWRWDWPHLAYIRGRLEPITERLERCLNPLPANEGESIRPTRRGGI